MRLERAYSLQIGTNVIAFSQGRGARGNRVKGFRLSVAEKKVDNIAVW